MNETPTKEKEKERRKKEGREIDGDLSVRRPQARGPWPVDAASSRFQRIRVTFSQWPTPVRGGGARCRSFGSHTPVSERGFPVSEPRSRPIFNGNDGHQEHVVSAILYLFSSYFFFLRKDYYIYYYMCVYNIYGWVVHVTLSSLIN